MPLAYSVPLLGLKQQWALKVNTDCSTNLGRSTNTGSSLQQETTISSYVKQVYSLHQTVCVGSETTADVGL
ncbi:hypothetical protein PAMP_019647 [Pampus punctatissimus]